MKPGLNPDELSKLLALKVDLDKAVDARRHYAAHQIRLEMCPLLGRATMGNLRFLSRMAKGEVTK